MAMTEGDWSIPETDVLASIRDLLDAGRSAVIATVIDVEGSAYRRPGAKMLVEEGGEGLGHITAGCLEDEVFALAADITEAGEPRIETYDLMEDEDDVWGLGVGCNGIIDILLEPLDEGYRPAIEAFEAGHAIGVITAVSGDAPLGAKAYYRNDEVTVGEGFPEWLADAVAEPAATLVADGGADTVRVETPEGSAEVFIDGIRPAPELVVFGSGHDVGPVVELGKKTDFRVTVVGFRGGVNLEARFPAADAVTATSPTNAGGVIERPDDTYAVVMTHNFIDDRLAMESLIDTNIPYIGLMGPRERFEEMLEEFEAEGRVFAKEDLNPVYTPIGLDLGGGSPYQIATSIVGEVMAVANDREPKHLKDREGPIHDRTTIDTPEVSD